MKESICELAREPMMRDEGWQRHAADCRDCRELLSVAEWMTTLAATTPPGLELPAASYLLFKARIQERRLAADRAVRPVHAMTIGAGILFLAAAGIGTVLGRETRFGWIMVGTFKLLAEFAGLILLAVTIVAVICSAAAYFDGLARANGSES